jgi:hypothetical protein
MVTATHAQTFRVEGAVRDSSGASIAGAQVDLHAGSYTASTTTDPSGEFAFERVPGPSGTVIVNARGFDPLEKAWTAAINNIARLEITLAPSAVNQSVIVTATRSQTLLSDVPLSDINDTVDVQAIRPSPSTTLRRSRFSLFRRQQPHRNPTAQGVSPRASAPAFSRVLFEDGIPLTTRSVPGSIGTVSLANPFPTSRLHRKPPPVSTAAMHSAE